MQPRKSKLLPCPDGWPVPAQGYRLGDAQMQFEIDVEVSVSSAAGNSSQSLSLDPSTPTALSSDGSVSAQLLGDLASYQASPNFGFAILMIPSPNGAQPLVWLLPSCTLAVLVRQASRILQTASFEFLI